MRILIILLLISNFTFAQYWGGSEINDSDLSNWLPEIEIEYAGSYHFGESESESDFHLFFSEDVIIGFVQSGYWEENTSLRKSNYINLTNIVIDKAGNFTSDQYTGKFINYKTDSGEYLKGLKINNPWTSWIEDSAFEIGIKTKLEFNNIYYGKYGKASFMKLNPHELKKMNAGELRIMKNEIYARYGYTFIENSKMDIYFRNQNWYRPEHKNVDHFLNKIELYNIKMIAELE
ncbi:YARHG domain-containing protein [Bizionia argentinensis JUB59]|uniref:YARHG domain-containing protein n=1 Tax=Bizionia argentinensis JUB59 TaxID=1046627 RepID=G2EFF1_9FLAO|nr:YARHG domain-containing protein [Bizionia argentinensis]EGV42842.1 YARHG domain-containing protein [Bizionia argentinensis JUB59]